MWKRRSAGSRSENCWRTSTIRLRGKPGRCGWLTSRSAPTRCGSNWIFPDAGAGRLEVTFQEMGGRLVPTNGWTTTARASDVLQLALAGFDKVAGADLRRDDIESLVGPVPHEVTAEGLTVWPDDQSEVVYDLNAEPEIRPRVVAGKPSLLPAVPAERLLFRRRPVPWDGWVAAWDNLNAPDGKD